LYPWDAAAGVLLVQEARGAVSSLSGGPFDPWNPKLIAASSGKLLQAMRKVIQQTE
jgi:fructose-1,6-bisphosphatase/inositol monophosphatase family enzyme